MARNNSPLFLLTPIGAMLTGMAFAQGTPPPSNSETTLAPVEVKGERDREARGYQGGTTGVGKLQQLPRDIPQSVTIIPEQLIYDRAADSMREALRNVPGLTFNAGEGGRIGDNITLRGYSVVGDLYMDGVRDVAQYNRETFNIEQFDILRGAASMLFGRGSTGGVINQVSKTPTMVDRNTLSYTVGSHDYNRLTGDFNKKVGENAAIRLNVMKTDAGSSRDNVSSERWGIAPSVRFGVGTRDEVTLSYYQLKYDNTPDFGVPYYKGQPLDVPVGRFYGLATDYQRDDAAVASATWKHRFSADTEVKTVLRKGDYHRDLWGTAPRLSGVPASILGTTPMNRQAQRRAGEEHTVTLQSDLTTKFTSGGFKHLVLAGVELLREEGYRWNWGGGGANPATTVGNPNPFAALPANYFSSAVKTGEVRFNADTVGLYVQDIIELGPRWKLLVGTRHDSLDAKYDRAAPQGDLARKDSMWSYRGGLMFQPGDTQSYYIAYGTSFNPSAELYALDDRTANTPPEKNRNMEIGAKWELFDGDLSLRSALFRTEKHNERNTDLALPNLSLLSGKRHTDGIEFEAAGRITKNWEVFGGVAFMNGKIDSASAQQAGTRGRVPINTPEYTASLWTTYKLPGGWKLGGGYENVGSRYGDQNNTVTVPAYWRTDALVAYEQSRYALRMNVYNVFNKKYYEGVYSGHVVPGTLRTVLLTAELKF
jgi:catecholate siderophore receptor